MSSSSSSFRYHDRELNPNNRHSKRKCVRTMNAHLLFAGCLFIFGCIFLFLGWLPSHLRQRQYIAAQCVGAIGRVEWHYCSGGCDGCHVDCWTVYMGLSAVPNVTAYIEQATFAQETTAMSAMLAYVGQDMGTCYYTNGGVNVRLTLPDDRVWLVLSCVTFGMLGVVLLVIATAWACKKCQQRRSMKGFQVMQVMRVDELEQKQQQQEEFDVAEPSGEMKI